MNLARFSNVHAFWVWIVNVKYHSTHSQYTINFTALHIFYKCNPVSQTIEEFFQRFTDNPNFQFSRTEYFTVFERRDYNPAKNYILTILAKLAISYIWECRNRKFIPNMKTAGWQLWKKSLLSKTIMVYSIKNGAIQVSSTTIPSALNMLLIDLISRGRLCGMAGRGLRRTGSLPDFMITRPVAADHWGPTTQQHTASLSRITTHIIRRPLLLFLGS
jgi:hypothetical protein